MAVTVVGFLASTFLGWLHPSRECSAAESGPENASPALGQRLAHEGSRDLSNTSVLPRCCRMANT
jgi:hypothetical protein